MRNFTEAADCQLNCIASIQCMKKLCGETIPLLDDMKKITILRRNNLGKCLICLSGLYPFNFSTY